MRMFIAFTLVAAGCTNVPSGGSRYDSVRDRLSDAPTALFIEDETSHGTITARRRTGDGWSTGASELAIEHGYVRAAVDATGQLTVDELELAVAPIPLEGVFQKPAVLKDVRLRLAAPARSAVAWTSDNDATATVPISLDFDWSIAFDGGEAYPLATQHLPPESVAIALGGSGDHVDALFELEAAGELWNWADLIQITEISLALSAATAD